MSIAYLGRESLRQLKNMRSMVFTLAEIGRAHV